MEINPLVVTTDGKVLALDCKMNFDDNALFRHRELEALRDLDEEDPAEIEAKKFDLSFIKLDGNIGCMVNGAGLAMATMDIIKHFGGQPANFLDVGGGATTEKVTAAFKIITADPAVKGIFVNIFGGIMKCDTIADGIIAAVKEVGLKVPLVVRLEGTNVELGKKLLAESGLAVTTANDMADGAKKIVAAAKEARLAMSILVDKNTKVLVQGITGSAGTFHAKQMREYGTADRRRRDARQGRHHPRGLPGLRHRRRTPWPRPAPTPRSSTCRRPGAADAILEAAAAGIELDRLHHRGDPGPGHGAGQARAGAATPSWCWSAPTAPASSRPASARSGSCPATSTPPATSASCPARAR